MDNEIDVKTTRLYNRLNKKTFFGCVSEVKWFNYMNDTLSIDKNLKTFIDIVLSIHSYSFPITRLPRKKIEAPWINRHIQKMISTKRHLLKHINKDNESSHKIKLHTVNKRLKKTIWQSRNNYYYTNRFFS